MWSTDVILDRRTAKEPHRAAIFDALSACEFCITQG
jgi:hypothetical protein